MLSPFRGFWDLRNEINRMFDDMWEGWRPLRREEQEWVPAIDAFSRDGDLVIRAELPGVKKDDVDITVQNGVLTISGERREEQEEERRGYHVRERRYGSFRRSMTLPEGVDESKIHAKFEDGVLEVVVEGASGQIGEPRRIPIEGPSGS
ncbi:Hsp20/alpha crystallin family protein [Rubrobacter calidifluminis]|uniref:Hsp20/alpha crystallin family protein n=1 Tax=Rubrobacter calidifluminis TaxID=1392640 RepID=UPI00235DEA14|nr:Hsp20/alpha crystallin family protein [Rubrobacter calidifluminis]